jgi:branched-chain amino acid transport system substrate-binding protein
MPRVRALISASLAALSILSSCASLPAASGKPIRIGWIGPLTGEMALWGISELDAIKMEVESVNALGGIELGGRGRLLELVPADDRGDVNGALLAAGDLIRAEKVVAILGPNGGSRAGAVAQAAEEAGIPMVATLATNPKVLVDENGRVRRYVFRAAFVDTYQGRAAAAYAYERLGLRRAAILEGAAYEYSAALARAFAAEFVARGGQVVADAAFLPEEADFREHFERFREARPEIVYMPLFYPDAGPAAATPSRCSSTR